MAFAAANDMLETIVEAVDFFQQPVWHRLAKDGILDALSVSCFSSA